MDKNIPALLRTDTKTIAVSFFQYEQTGGPPPFSTDQLITEEKIHIFITDQVINVGELVLVLFGNLPRIAVVKEAHATLQISPNSDKEYKWVLARVNLSNYYKNITRNGKIIAAVTSAYSDSTKESFTSNLLAALPQAAKDALLAELAKNG